jgi:hypothetical protein
MGDAVIKIPVANKPDVDRAWQIVEGMKLRHANLTIGHEHAEIEVDQDDADAVAEALAGQRIAARRG